MRKQKQTLEVEAEVLAETNSMQLTPTLKCFEGPAEIYNWSEMS